MPAQKSQSSILSKLGDSFGRAFDAHKADAIDPSSFGELPGGVEGIAQLSECKFTEIAQGKENAGKLTFYAAGIVHYPLEHNGVKCAGKRTSIIENVFDTPKALGTRKTIEDHVAYVVQQLKRLGLEGVEEMSYKDLPAAMEALKDAGPFFRFVTRKGKKQTTGPYKDMEPRVFHMWEGVCDYTPEDAEVDDTSDDEEEVTAANPPTRNGKAYAPPKATNRVSTASNGAPAKAPTTKKTKAAPPPKDLEFGDVDSLVKGANAGDGQAQEELKDLATKAGVSEEDFDAAGSWQEAADLITAGKATPKEEEEAEETEEEGGGGEDEDASPVPEVEQMVRYRPLDKKTNKPVKRPVECEIVSVDKKAQTCTLKNMDDGKSVYKSVPWASLEVDD